MRVVTVARKPCDGGVTQNVLGHGCGALDIDGARVAGPAWARSTETIEDIRGGRYGTASKDRIETGPREMPAGGRWPANLVVHAPIMGELDRQSGYTISGRHGGAPGGFGAAQLYGDGSRTLDLSGGYADSGAASRFFKVVS